MHYRFVERAGKLLSIFPLWLAQRLTQRLNRAVNFFRPA
jgi:hypothetical protein